MYKCIPHDDGGGEGETDSLTDGDDPIVRLNETGTGVPLVSVTAVVDPEAGERSGMVAPKLNVNVAADTPVLLLTQFVISLVTSIVVAEVVELAVDFDSNV